MKRWSIMAVVVLMIGLWFPIKVTAHPGNTDGAGGHYNRSTGQYHYHHGHSAHQHKDEDENGVLDYCPFGDYIFETQKETQEETYYETNSNVLLGKTMMVCAVIVFLVPIFLEKEPLWDQITRFLGYIIPVALMTGVLSLLIMLVWLPFGAKADAVANDILRILFPVSVCVYIVLVIVSYKKEKEKIETAEVCIFLVGICHIIFVLAMEGILTLGLGWSLYIAFLIISIAWIMEVLVHQMDGILLNISIVLGMLLIAFFVFLS